MGSLKGVRASRVWWVVLFALVLCAVATAPVFADPEENDTTALSAPPKAGVELKSERTATSETFRFPDGSRETRIHETPIHYMDASGDWQSIGDHLEAAENGGLVNGPNRFDVELPTQLDAAPVRLSIGGEWVSSELLGTELEAVELEGNAARYESSAEGTSFEFSSLANGLKEEIEIADPSQPSTFHFALDASVGLTPVLTEGGAVEFRDEHGDVFAILPAPVVSDSASQPNVSDAVHYSLSPLGDGWTLVVEADRDWLSQPERVWPVRIDPTTTVLGPSSDCVIANGALIEKGLCSSSGWSLLGGMAKYLSNGKHEYARSLLKFSLGSIPSNSYVSAATVGLYAPNAAINTSGVQLRRATKSWTNSVNWLKYDGTNKWMAEGGDYEPSQGSEILTANRGSQAGWWEFSGKSLISLVNGWVSGSVANQGLLLRLSNEKEFACGESLCPERKAEFFSSASAETKKRPYLSVTYYPPAPKGSKMTSPTEGTRSARRFKLSAAWEHAGVTGIYFQYKGLEGWVDVPASKVLTEDGKAVEWPLATEGAHQSPPVYWDAPEEIAQQPQVAKGPIRAVLVGTIGAEGYTEAVNVVLDRNVGGTKDAVASVGPGTVNLLTGNLTISRADVSIPGFGSALEFTRTNNSKDAEVEEKGVLGKGWKPGVVVEAAGGAEWRSVQLIIPSAAEKEEGLTNYALLTDLEGYEYAFEEDASGTFITPPEVTGWLLTKSGNEFTLADPGGNRTVFENSSGGTEYLPMRVSQTGGTGNKTQMVYDIVGGNRRLSMIIAPYAAGLGCSLSSAKTELGCRSLSFSYLSATNWGGSFTLGDRLASITYYGPSNASTMGNWTVAQYKYDSAGRLIEEWDPRISPGLKESYTYPANSGRLTTITPPGEEPWTLEYGTYKESNFYNGRLMRVKRASLLESPSVAETTIVYGVPVSGSGAPYDMSAAAVAQWGQEDFPTDATAIFPPDEVPANPPTSYSRATVYYLDVEGQQVNTAAAAGAGTTDPSITTSETDEHGNAIRELSAQNRLRALAEGAKSVARSHELEVKRAFSVDGTELQEEWGPLHEVRLESGSTAQARAHTTLEYDDGWDKTGVKPHLPTRVTVAASIPGKGTDADPRVTETKYDWTLRQPTETIVDPSGLKLITRVAYDKESGLPIERSLPAEPEGKDARTTKTLYYTAGTHPSDSYCSNKPAFANLPCKALPAAQPKAEGNPELLVTTYVSYNQLGRPLEVIESPGGGASNTRKTITTYDAAGRPTSTKQEGGGTAIPPTETLYSPTTGRPTTQRFGCASECTGSISYSKAFGEAGTGSKKFAQPAGSAVDSSGNLWVVDKGNNRLQKFDAEGNFLTEFGKEGSGSKEFKGPSDIAIDASGNLWVTDVGNHRLKKFDPTGKPLMEFGSQGSGNGEFSGYGPRGIAIDAQGDLWVSDYSTRVQEFNPEGKFIQAVGSFGESAGLDAGKGKIWVGDWTKNKVRVFAEGSGKELFSFGSEGTGKGQFVHPDSVEVDSSGNVWVGDEGNDRIVLFDDEGNGINSFGSKGSGAGQLNLNWPTGISTDAKDNLWVSDSANNRMQLWTATGKAFDRQATRTTYDTLGRPISYEDADDNSSSIGYDLLSRPVVFSDGKGIKTTTYDATSGLPVKVEDSAAGTFTASYDADGSLVAQGLPNGLVAETTYDETGAPVHLRYQKTVNCVSECTWLEEDVEESIHGQWLSRTGTLSSQQYSYDAASRLTQVKDTPQGGGCTTRTYSFDADSNRTALITRAPGEGGACDTSSKGTVQEYKYDTADRLLGSELTYDNFGRITSLPKAFSGGGTLTSTYYSNDLIRSQNQDGITNTYELDAMLRQRQRVQSGSKSGTETYHYAGPSDSPAWIDRGSSWSRNISALGSFAVQDSKEGTTLQLTNLHGDVTATASLSIEATKLLATFESDEFGNPKGTAAGKYGWLGGKGRRTELSSGVVQMGIRSYIPALGRFISTDPVSGGSANAYDYGNADPVNQFDPSGTKPWNIATTGPCTGQLHVYSPKGGPRTRGGYGKFYARFKIRCGAASYVISVLKVTRQFKKVNSDGAIAEHTNRPSNASGPHWNDGEWGNWQESKRPTKFDCLMGVEYEYTYEIQIKWASPAGTVIIKDESIAPPGEGTLRLKAQEKCGHGRY